MSTTTTEIITCEDPTCDVDLPCVSCTVTFLKATGEWENVKSSRLWADLERSELIESRPTREHDATSTGTGSGGISRGRGFRPATDKQMAYLLHLAAQLSPGLSTVLERDLTGLSTAEASELIDLARAELERMPAPAVDPEAPVIGRWKKTPSGWGIFAPGAEQGQEITVRRSSGEERQVVLGHQLGQDIYAEAKQATEERQTKRRGFSIEAGRVYRTSAGEIVRVQESRQSGQLYGKVWNGSSFEYASGIIRKITEALTLEEAQEFGHATGRCCLCSRELTDPASIEAGIGPVCAAKGWG